tara:strand:+ start:92 stop:1150 length:1059 start_codon:yes stop_codon:yes gene_type:complete
MNILQFFLKFKFNLFFLMIFGGCYSTMGLLTAPKKIKEIKVTNLAIKAEKEFWDSFHKGNYKNIDNVLFYLQAAYLENPNNSKLASYIGFSHMWKVSEREKDLSRGKNPLITNSLDLAVKYFQTSIDLDRSDPRVLGFLGYSNMSAGTVHKDEYQKRQGYFQAKKAADLWPEWGLFGLSYLLGKQPYDSDQFKEAIKSIWKNVEVCSGKVFKDRESFDYNKFTALRPIYKGKKRVCWNSWIAPHNLEGFMVIHGDLVTKQGKVDIAKKIYQAVKNTPDYNSWHPKYKKLVEHRIKNVKKNVSFFRKGVHQLKSEADSYKVPLFNSRDNCLICHQGSNKNGWMPKYYKAKKPN